MTIWPHPHPNWQCLNAYSLSSPSWNPTYYSPTTAKPLSVEVLYFERLYLLHDLQKANDKATELLRRIVPLEELIIQTAQNRVRRKTKKQVGWLKCRVAETARQEQALLARLSELTYEIQSREWLMQIESGQAYHEQLLGAQVPKNYAGHNAHPRILMTDPSVEEYSAAVTSERDVTSCGQHYYYGNDSHCKSREQLNSPQLTASDQSVVESPGSLSLQSSIISDLYYPASHYNISYLMLSESAVGHETMYNRSSLPRPASACGPDAESISKETALQSSGIRRNSLPELSFGTMYEETEEKHF